MPSNATEPKKPVEKAPAPGLMDSLRSRGKSLSCWFRARTRLERVFLILLPCYILALSLALGAFATGSLAIATYVAGALIAIRWARAGTRKFVWRLRNRLIVVYLFIAVVPILLLLILIGVGAWILTGQVAMFIVTSELDRRAQSLLDPARGIATAPAASRMERARWIAPYFRQRFPGFEMLVRAENEFRYPEGGTLTPPPRGWKDASGLILKGSSVNLWAHAVANGVEVVMLVPMNHDALSTLVPNLGALTLVGPQGEDRNDPKSLKATVPKASAAVDRRVPPASNALDGLVTFVAPVALARWSVPGVVHNSALIIDTRYSAVLRTIFGQKVELHGGYTIASIAAIAFVGTSCVFLLFELVSLVIGISLTRSITGAVHNLYVGTEHVREGDFAHRIPVRGNDQLAELTTSFNRMTENLQRLVEVAKEKERLQSELEIAREVQDQLYPKTTPTAETLTLSALCRPARMVSGDYYDYLNLEAPNLALAIGDVAGKGISAALLMATVQSTMRTQLRAGREMVVAAGNGHGIQPISTAGLVSRLNQQLYAFTPPEKFATFYFAVYDDATGLLTYTNAGHLPPAIIRNGDRLRLEVTGTVVGAFPFAQYEEASIQLERGDLLVCFTDGLTEPENEYGEMYGEDRLIELVARHADSEPGEIIAAVMDAVREWTGSPELQDDMTMLLARRS